MANSKRKFKLQCAKVSSILKYIKVWMALHLLICFCDLFCSSFRSRSKRPCVLQLLIKMLIKLCLLWEGLVLLYWNFLFKQKVGPHFPTNLENSNVLSQSIYRPSLTVKWLRSERDLHSCEVAVTNEAHKDHIWSLACTLHLINDFLKYVLESKMESVSKFVILSKNTFQKYFHFHETLLVW